MEPTTEQLWESVRDRLIGFVSRRIDDPADVEDIVQEVFLRVHRHIDSVENADRLVSWLFQITRNVIADRYRARARRTEVALSEGGARVIEALSEPPGAAVASDADTAQRELASCLLPMLRELPDKYRQALELVELEGHTQTAVAGRLGLSVSGMKSRTQRGRRMLRDMLLECCHVSMSAAGGVMDYEPIDGATGCRDCG